MIHLLGTVGLYVGTLAAFAFVASYQLFARWWASEEGRHMMSFTTVLALALGYFSYRTLTTPALPLPRGTELARTLIFNAIAWVLVWRCWLLGRKQIWASWRRHSKEER